MCAEAEGFEPSEPCGSARSCLGKLLLSRRASNVLVSTAHPYFRWISGAKVQYPYAAFLRSKIYFQKSSKKVVDSWNTLMIFNLSTLELDNGSQLLFFAGSWIVNSAKEKRIGYKLATNLKCEKKKSPVNHWFTGLFLMRFRMGLNQRPPD